MVTFLLLFTNKKSFQSVSFSLRGSREAGVVWCPSSRSRSRGPHPHLLHDALDLVLQLLRQMGPPPARSRGQEAETVDGTKLPLHLPTRLEQPGAGRGEHEGGKGLEGGMAACEPRTQHT